MGAWEIKGPVRGTCRSWRDVYPEFANAVERIRAPLGRGIAWEGTEIWAYKDRPRNIDEALLANIRRYPDREAYVFHPGGVRMTWREIGDKVDRAAYRLRHRYGFVKGDRFCLLSPGCPEYVIGYLAIQRLGGIAVPVNLGLASDGIAAQVNTVGAKGLVASPAVWREKVGAIRTQLTSVQVVFMTGDVADDKTTAFSLLIDTAAGAPIHEDIDEWDVCAISFTSGTTGAPKGTMAMHINALGCAQNIINVSHGLTTDDINICMPPLYHNTAVYSDLLPALLSGGKCVVMAAFSPLEAIELIESEKATWAAAAPIMLWMMMNHADFHQYDCSRFRKIIFGGHAASETYINQLKSEFDPSVMVNGGSVSESTAMGFALPTEDAIRKITSCGLATPNTEIAIFDDDGSELTQPDAIGEVGYKGQQTNAGYWEQPDRTREVFRKDGYVLSGDWAKIDAEGYLWLLDRKKDMVVRGGQNVYCIEVENKLYLHPKVLRAAVVGVPDHVFSERIKAVLVCKPGQNLTAAEIRQHCAGHLAHYEIPEYIAFTFNMPTNPAGKTLKQPLVDYWGDGPVERALQRFEMFCQTMPEALMDLEHIKVDQALMTPRNALAEMRASSELGRRIEALIDESGVAELLKPREARFNSWKQGLRVIVRPIP
jgi:acyl-CoA synthetase (AMP-forming)/AMP-acid ligase II